MKTRDVLASAVANAFRSKTRTFLTVLAIFIGAFTLSITTGLGTGINDYIDDTLSELGASNDITVTHAAEDQTDGPQEYDPDRVTAGGGGFATSVDPITEDDLDEIAGIAGVASVTPTTSVSVDYVEGASGTPYEISTSTLTSGMTLQLEAGSQPDADGSDAQVVIPSDYVDVLGYDDAEDAVGQEVTIGLTDAAGDARTVAAEVAGVSEAGLISGGTGLTMNTAFHDELYDLQSTGLTDEQLSQYPSATVTVADDATDEDVAAVERSLQDARYDTTTVADMLGSITTVIDGIVLVLNGFAIIALLAAALGIVNTLFMSVQERTREIGLMKAMGMGGGRIFALFSSEAAFIGFLGSAIGAGLAILAGTLVSGVLSTTVLSDLAGLTLLAFDPVSIAGIILLVMAIAFLAGTLPAARAARKDPIEALRYE